MSRVSLPPAKARWNGSDDAKLRQLIADKSIDPRDRSKATIQKIHTLNWPHKNYMTFMLDSYAGSSPTTKLIRLLLKREKCSCMLSCEYHFNPQLTNHSCSVPDNYAGEGEEEEGNDDFEPNNDTDILLGQEDKVIDNNKLSHLEEDAVANMMTKSKTSISPKPKPSSSSQKKAVVDDITARVTQMSLAPVVATPPSISLDFKFPLSKYTVMEDRITKIFIELIGCQLPDDYLKHAKVLPGRRQFSILIGAPRFMFEEGFIKVRMGDHWDSKSAAAVSFNSQVIQPVRQMFPGNSDSIDGNPMIVDLPEQCLEGNAEFLNGDWKVRRIPKVEGHKQYLRGWTFCIEAVRRNLVKVSRAERVVFGYGDSGESSSSSEENEMGN